MKKKYLYSAIAIIVIGCIAIFIFQKMNAGEKLVEEFLRKSLAQSEENIELFETIQESAILIGEGVDEKTEKESQQKAEEAEKKVKNLYGKYLNDSGMEDFETGIFAFLFQLYMEDKSCNVLKVDVTEDNSYYKFSSNLEIDGQEQVIEGRVEISDGKIAKIKVENL